MTESTETTETVKAPHDCGMCDAPLVWDGLSGEHDTYVCSVCDYWHISVDCCDRELSR